MQRVQTSFLSNLSAPPQRPPWVSLLTSLCPSLSFHGSSSRCWSPRHSHSLLSSPVSGDCCTRLAGTVVGLGYCPQAPANRRGWRRYPNSSLPTPLRVDPAHLWPPALSLGRVPRNSCPWQSEPQASAGSCGGLAGPPTSWGETLSSDRNPEAVPDLLTLPSRPTEGLYLKHSPY